MAIVPPPTQAGFLTFIRNSMGISSTVLPDNSDVIATAFQVAMDLTNIIINQVSPIQYTLAVYNLGGSNVINYAQDVTPPVPYKTLNETSYTYFDYFRALWKINDFVTGVVESTSDVSTSVSLKVQPALGELTLADLNTLKDPYGRRYLGIAQQFGTLWGLS